MTIYFTVVPDTTPAMQQWARAEAALRAREEAEVRSPHDLAAYKRRRAFRRRKAGLSRAITRRLMAMVDSEQMERAA
jgi:hypothetical protein